MLEYDMYYDQIWIVSNKCVNTYPVVAKFTVKVMSSWESVASWLEKDE